MKIKNYVGATRPYALTLLRIWLGGVMIWYSFPVLFQGGLRDFGHYLNMLGMPMPQVLAVIAKCLEFIGGSMVLTGFYGRIGGLMIAIVMLVACGAAHNFKILTEGGIAFNLCIMGMTVLLGGTGKFSLVNWPGNK